MKHIKKNLYIIDMDRQLRYTLLIKNCGKRNRFLLQSLNLVYSIQTSDVAWIIAWEIYHVRFGVSEQDPFCPSGFTDSTCEIYSNVFLNNFKGPTDIHAKMRYPCDPGSWMFHNICGNFLHFQQNGQFKKTRSLLCLLWWNIIFIIF